MEEIGRRLRTARESREISLQRAEDETKIRRKYLEALELGREADLPGDVYLKGFLRTYGNYLGLNGPALVEEYKEWKGAQEAAAHPGHGHTHAGSGHNHDERARAVAEQAAARSVVKPEPAPAVKAPVQKAPQSPVADSSRSLRRTESTSWIYTRQAGWAVLGIVVAGVVFYGGYRILGQLGDKPAAQQQPAPVAVNPIPQPQPTQPTPAAEPPKVTMSAGEKGEYKFAVPSPEVQVKFEIGGSGVWVNATVDGKQVFDGTTRETKEFKGREVKIRAGHMEGVKLVVNGQRFDQPLPEAPSYLLIFTATK